MRNLFENLLRDSSHAFIFNIFDLNFPDNNKINSDGSLQMSGGINHRAFHRLMYITIVWVTYRYHTTLGVEGWLGLLCYN